MRVIHLRGEILVNGPNVGLSKTSKIVFGSSIILSPCMTFIQVIKSFTTLEVQLKSTL